MPAERVDWRHEPTLSSKSTRSSNTSRVPLLSACAPLESLPVFFVHKAVIRVAWFKPADAGVDLKRSQAAKVGYCRRQFLRRQSSKRTLYDRVINSEFLSHSISIPGIHLATSKMTSIWFSQAACDFFFRCFSARLGRRDIPNAVPHHPVGEIPGPVTS
jgi:hypothetical protein